MSRAWLRSSCIGFVGLVEGREQCAPAPDSAGRRRSASPPRRARQQEHAEPNFERRDQARVTADRRLPEPARGRRESRRRRRRVDEGKQRGMAVHGFPPSDAMMSCRTNGLSSPASAITLARHRRFPGRRTSRTSAAMNDMMNDVPHPRLPVDRSRSGRVPAAARCRARCLRCRTQPVSRRRTARRRSRPLGLHGALGKARSTPRPAARGARHRQTTMAAATAWPRTPGFARPAAGLDARIA